MTDGHRSTTNRNLTICECCGDTGSTDPESDPVDGAPAAVTDGGTSTDDDQRSGGHHNDDRRSSDPRWLAGDDVLDASLPPDVQSLLGTAIGEDGFETMGAWVAAGRRLTGGGALEVADLCHTDKRTGHWGEYDGDRYDFQCFYDAVALAALVDDWVAIHTETPGGVTLEFGAAPDGDLVDVPENAVLSFGVSKAVDPPTNDDAVTETIYGAMCPYVRAFEDYEAYREWADDVDAATIAMPLAEASDVALALTE